VTQAHFAYCHGTALGLGYAKGESDNRSADPSTFDKKECALILIEIGFCRNFGYKQMIVKKTKKCPPLIAALKTY